MHVLVAICTLILLTVNVVQADNSQTNSFFNHFQRSKDLTADRLQSYLLSNPLMTEWVIEYVSQLPAHIITLERKQTLLKQLSPPVDDETLEMTTSKALPVIESSNRFYGSQINDTMDILPKSQSTWNYRFNRGPIIEYRLSGESRIEWDLRNRLILYEMDWD